MGIKQFIICQGFARKGMLSVVLGAVLNLVLDPIFIFALHMDVLGAALATVLSQLASCLYVLRFLFSKKVPIPISFGGYRPRLMGRILLTGMTPFLIIGVDNIVPLLNQVLGMIKIKGKPLGLELMDIDWFQLASHGKVMTDASQAATYGTRVFVKGDASETLIAVLRYLVEVVNYKDNYNTVASLVGSLIGGSDNSSITDVVGTVLNMLKGDTDKVIGELCNLLQQLGG